MSSKSEQILDLIKAAINLANSVQQDIEEHRSISDDTVVLLSRFSAQHNALGDLLDVVEATLTKGGPNGEH